MTYWLSHLYDEKYNRLASGEFNSLEGAKEAIKLENKKIVFVIIIGSDNGEIHKYKNDGTTLTEVFE